MTTINLDGKWKLYYYPENEIAVDTPKDIQKQGLTAIESTVPGNVELDLLRAGLIPDPYIGNNVYALREYEKYGWIYTRDFRLQSAPTASKRLEAVFRGVDCIAEYWLNGRKFGSSANALIEQRFDITDFVNAEEENHLVIIIRSPLVQAMDKDYYPSMISYLDALERLWVRKPAHTYGWDIMPRVFSSGIWRSAFIEVHKENEIEEMFFQTLSANDKTARLKVFFRIRQQSQMLGKLQLKLSGKCGSSTFLSTRQLDFNAGNIDINVANPCLWNPRGYGSPHLYEVKAELIKDGEVLQAKDYSIGIRTVELIRTERETIADEGEFLFKINGMPILCKGTNWVPLDAFHSRDADKYQETFRLVLESNSNIVRCWGGNVYEDHMLFDLCDRNGVMVWQEFAMACAAYPLDERFYEDFRTEARQIIKELRNHPSLIVWCGDNECDLFYYLAAAGMDPDKNTITRKVLPEIVFKNDPYRPLINTSPYMPPAMAKVKGLDLKDMRLLTENHIWAPRDYFKSKAYTEAKANFIGEIGYHGCPNLSSIKRFIEKDHLWPWKGNSQWIAHSGSAPLGLGKEMLNAYTRNDLMADQIREFFGIVPENIEDFILASQVCQAEAYKYFIESTRIKKWRRTGVIWWNMLDGWPQFSDSVVDYYFGRKLAFYYISRVQDRFCIMLDEPDSWKLGIIAGNDSNEDIGGNYIIREADNGSIMAEGDFFVRANENKRLGNLNERISIGNQRLFLIEWTIEGKTYGNHYLLGYPPFNLAKYHKWLEKISALPVGFDPAAVGK